MKLEEAKQVTLQLRMPADAHPANIQGAGPSSDTARSAMAALYNTHAQILGVEGKAPVERHRELVEPARALAEKTIRSAGKAIDTLTAQKEMTLKKLASKLAPKVSETVQAEIRAHFKGRGKDAFNEAFGLAREGDPAALAVLAGPSFLSGLDKKQADILRVQAEKVFAPDETRDRDEVEIAIERVTKETDRFTTTVTEKLKKWSRGSEQSAAELLGVK